MVIILGTSASAETNDITSRLIEARVNEFANEFQRLGDYNYATASTLQSTVDQLQKTSMSPRTRIIEVMRNVLETDESIFAVWTAWEPNALDGADADYVNADEYHDGTGRFVPYIYRSGNSIYAESLTGYDDPVNGLFYQGARNSGRPYVTDPYVYSSGGISTDIYSIAIPILRDGAVAGAVGIDVLLDDVVKIVNEASILDDGYIFILSPNGSIAAHRDRSMIYQHYSQTWMRSLTGEMATMLNNGDSFAINTYSDIISSDVSLLGNGILIGATDRNWGVLGVVPSATVNASSLSLIITVAVVGVAAVLFVGIVTFILVGICLKKLPGLTAMAENIADGKLNFNTEADDGLPTKNEITLLQRSFGHVVGVINNLVDDLNQIGKSKRGLTPGSLTALTAK